MFAALRHRILVTRGNVLLRKERWQPAAMLLGMAVRMDPDNWESNNNLACALLKLERWEEAAGIAQRAISVRPDASASHEYFGIALLKMERWEEAAASYRRALAAAPDCASSYERLGLALIRLARWEEAAETYRRAVDMGAADRAMFERLGSVLCILKLWDEAAVAFRRAKDLRSDGEDPFRDLPSEYAAQVYWRLLSLEADATHSINDFANDLVTLNSSPETLGAHRRAVALAPQDAAAHLALGIELSKLSHWEEAERVLRHGASLVEANAAFHFLRVDPLVRLGRLEEATEAHAHALTRGGAFPTLPGGGGKFRFETRRAALWTRDNLSDDAFEVGRWLASLAPANAPERSAPAAGGPKLLFVLDNDYGELTTIMYLMLGQPLAREATLLLPERLFAHNADIIPGRTHRFETVADVVEVVERESPEVVFLCSGYLFSTHQILSVEDLGHLVDLLRRRGCRVVTSDPFLGVLSKHDPRTVIRIDNPPTHSLFGREEFVRAQRTDEERLWVHFGRSERIFRNAFHLYPAYCGEPHSDLDRMDARNVSFFNERLLRPAPNAGGTKNAGGPPHWLFVLSHVDWDAQLLNEPALGFVDLVARKLVETTAAGRRAILIGPELLIEPLSHRLPTAEGIDLLSFCSFDQFTSLLLSAEVAFYWNLVSHSILIRLFNGLPVVLFDRGHLVRNVSAIEDRIVRWYYQGSAPVFRDHRQRLTRETVAAWIEDQQREASGLSARYRRAPAPDQMMTDILNGVPVPSI